MPALPLPTYYAAVQLAIRVEHILILNSIENLLSQSPFELKMCVLVRPTTALGNVYTIELDIIYMYYI